MERRLTTPDSEGLSAQMQASAVAELATARPVTMVWPSKIMAERNEGTGRSTMTSTALATPAKGPLSGGLLIVKLAYGPNGGETIDVRYSGFARTSGAPASGLLVRRSSLRRCMTT